MPIWGSVPDEDMFQAKALRAIEALRWWVRLNYPGGCAGGCLLSIRSMRYFREDSPLAEFHSCFATGERRSSLADHRNTACLPEVNGEELRARALISCQ